MTRLRELRISCPRTRTYRPSRLDAGEDDFDESIFVLGFAETKIEIPSASIVPGGQSPIGP
jgi:hypothetical protein